MIWIYPIYLWRMYIYFVIGWRRSWRVYVTENNFILGAPFVYFQKRGHEVATKSIKHESFETKTSPLSNEGRNYTVNERVSPNLKLLSRFSKLLTRNGKAFLLFDSRYILKQRDDHSLQPIWDCDGTVYNARQAVTTLWQAARPPRQAATTQTYIVDTELDGSLQNIKCALPTGRV